MLIGSFTNFRSSRLVHSLFFVSQVVYFYVVLHRFTFKYLRAYEKIESVNENMTLTKLAHQIMVLKTR